MYLCIIPTSFKRYMYIYHIKISLLEKNRTVGHLQHNTLYILQGCSNLFMQLTIFHIEISIHMVTLAWPAFNEYMYMQLKNHLILKTVCVGDFQ